MIGDYDGDLKLVSQHLMLQLKKIFKLLEKSIKIIPKY